MSTGVSIVGAGLSKFGRQPDHSGRELGVQAIEAALRDAGLEWADVQVAFGGSDGSGLADTLVADLGLTGIPFTNVKNGCATGGSALMSAVHAIRSGAAEVALAVGLRQAPARRVRPAARGLGPAHGVRRGRADGDHPVLRHQDRALPARAPHQRADPRPGGREGLPQRRAQPQRVAPRADPGRRDRRRGHGQRPADPADVLLTRRGWRRDRPHQRRRGCPHRSRGARCSVRPRAPVASAPSRCSAPRSRDRAGHPASAPTRRPPPSRRPASVPTRSTSRSCRTPRAVPRSCTWPSAASARTASRRRWSPAARPRSVAGCRSTPTAAASPTASRSGPRACARSTRSSPSCAARPGPARSPGSADRLHPCLRRPRHQRLHGAGGLSR